ncbi:MAG TPA: TetR family transcriptional regulator [Nocardioidaceae bacterium]|nr:TetR family transcriptional regulator [Nocardioidaceae bacterium]
MNDPASTRGRVLAALTTMLADRDWPDISVAQVAAAAGVSRQTIYNEFGARSTLADLYVEVLVDSLIREHVPSTEHVGDVDDLLARILTSWFTSVAADPVLVSDRGLLRGIVSDETAFVDNASRYLAQQYAALAPHVPEAQARILARVVVRLCVSYLLVPPSQDEDPVQELVAVLGPYTEGLLSRA